jgi:hypothetical protein
MKMTQAEWDEHLVSTDPSGDLTLSRRGRPPSDTQQLNVRLPVELVIKIEAMALQQGITKSKLIESIISQAM